MNEKTRKLIPVILSGGSGSRLWPLSRSTYPKQFLALTEPVSMLQATARRIADPDLFAPPIVICNDEHRFIIAEQLRAVDMATGDIVLEPVARNTAPAVTAACLIAAERYPDGIVLVLPSDHAIADARAFREALGRAVRAAEAGSLVTFGIRPTAPETGYGYIRRGEALAGIGECYEVGAFVEKPDPDTAARFVSGGDHYWNSGMFVFRADRLLAEIESHAPEVLAATRRSLAAARRDLDFTRLDEAGFSENPSISIDYAVMEKTADAAVVPCDIGWSDIGSWAALWQAGESDENGNVATGDVLMRDTENTLVHADRRLVATLGIRDAVIVETADAVMVADRTRAQDVREIVEALKQTDRVEATSHKRIYRPWGYYESIDFGSRYQVKQICVHPGRKLSLQMHHKRAEHWVIVEGTARVTRDEETLVLEENQSTYIPIGTRHRLENPGESDLRLVEVQTGSYLGEDDIVRFDDDYGRDVEDF